MVSLYSSAHLTKVRNMILLINSQFSDCIYKLDLTEIKWLKSAYLYQQLFKEEYNPFILHLSFVILRIIEIKQDLVLLFSVD